MEKNKKFKPLSFKELCILTAEFIGGQALIKGIEKGKQLDEDLKLFLGYIWKNNRK